MNDEQDQSDSQESVSNSEADDALLKQIRDDYRYCLDYWRENREEAEMDMQFVAGNPWTQAEVDKRKGRPCLAPDELSQYLKQANNNLRQNKRAIKVTPKGLGATDKYAQHRESIIRGIEHADSAQTARITSFEQATNSGMGARRIVLVSTDDSDGWDLEPRIKRIPNQFTVLLDPNAKEADFSDMNICFVTDTMRKSVFARRFPDAKKTSFVADDIKIAGDWFKGDNITVAEYWVRTHKKRKKLRVKSPEGPTTVYEDELSKDTKPDVINERDTTESIEVMQYITNGVEIIERNLWAGSWIPVIPVLGEEIYVSEGGQSKRKFMSLIRRARVPQKMLCYIASQEAEEFSMAPRAPFVVYEGQVDVDQEAWDQLNEVPRPYVKVAAMPDGQQGVLPLPTRPQFQPNIQAYEISRESWRRAIQSAMGITPLPTAAQRQNEKSGIALDKIQTAQATGAFHFTDNFDRSLINEGRQLNELITRVMDTPRHVPIRNADESHAMLAVSTSKHGAPELPEGANKDDYLITDAGEYGITIDTGPNFQSQREESSNFVDTIIQNLKGLPIPPPMAQKILSLAIRLKNLGPVGDEISDMLAPPDPNNIPPEAKAIVMQLQAQLQQAMQELQKMQMEKQAKVIDNQFSLQQSRENNEVKLAIAEIQTKAQDERERISLIMDEFQKMGVSMRDMQSQMQQHAHEAALAASGHENTKELADKQAATAAATQMSDQQHQQTMAEQAAEQQPAE